MRTIFIALSAVLLIAALLLTPGTVTAKKPVKPPPEPPPSVDDGVIYFLLGGVLNQENADGTGRKALTGISGEPSHALHDGKRWFLTVRPVDGDDYPSGTPRHELFAVSESGTAVQLTDDASLEADNSGPYVAGDLPRDWRYHARWAKDGTVMDGKVSYLAKRWGEDPSGDPEITEYGLYVITLDPDDLGDSTSLGLEPERLPVPFELYETTYGGLINSQMDWSPDGESIVYRRTYSETPGLYRSDVQSDGTWSTSRLTTAGYYPRWSPDGSRIAYQGGIIVMDPDGTDVDELVSNQLSGKTYYWAKHPLWSPAGTHIIYQYWTPSPANKMFSDAYRITADGDDKTNLTGDTGSWAYPIGWRSLD